MVLNPEQHKQLVWIRKEIDALKASNEIQEMTLNTLKNGFSDLEKETESLDNRIKRLKGNLHVIDSDSS